MQHLAIDLETLGTVPRSVILSVGAAFVDPFTGAVGGTFYRNVTVASQPNRVQNPDTLVWWSTQSAQARNALLEDQQPLSYVLSDFAQWVRNNAGGNAIPWGNGASFDLAILNDAYAEAASLSPWKFWNERCLRTLKNEVFDVEYPEFQGTPHNALDDAKHQARMVAALLQRMGRIDINKP
jgi:exodeoxyribonuclease VIII